ncbi:probable lactoylglutathione lyase, chloroplastic [Tanacetum coccineum]|uniref:Probable lactoylglutathione lyase, chloroplastic n=1 Tax=Tanacetum coccineum TaxID=301880 RepID=A0ABQ5BAZ9_9ASTR
MTVSEVARLVSELNMINPTPEPLCQLMLRVRELDHSIAFYKKAFGLELQRKRDCPEFKIAIGTDDVYKTAEAVKLFGGHITREPGPLPNINTKITACLDPDGWQTSYNDALVSRNIPLSRASYLGIKRVNGYSDIAFDHG